jgi:hypothetical protein
MLTNRLIDTRMELMSGSHLVEADEIQKTTTSPSWLGIHGADQQAQATASISTRTRPKCLTVASVKGGQTVLVNAGKSLVLDATTTRRRSSTRKYGCADRWPSAGAERLAMANPSSAKQVHDYGCRGANFANTNFASTVPLTNPCYNPCGG